MKCIKWCSYLFSLLTLSICLMGCFGVITEAEPDPNEIIYMDLGETQTFLVDGFLIGGVGGFKWETYPVGTGTDGVGKEFELVIDSEESLNKIMVNSNLLSCIPVFYCPLPPPLCIIDWACNIPDFRTWNIRVIQELPVWYGDYIIEDNADVNGLIGFAEITGSLSIYDDVNITNTDDNLINLEALGNLTTIGGDLSIGYHPLLTSLTGLDNLSSVGGDLNVYHDSLTSLTGLGSIESVSGSLIVTSTDALTSLIGLDSLISVEEDLIITTNHSLITLAGLESLTSVGGEVKISINGPLMSLSGLNNLVSIGGRLRLDDNRNLSTLTALSNLSSIGESLYISHNFSLTDLAGLENISSVGGSLSIHWNLHLTNLTGLNNFLSVGGRLSIENCSSLGNLSGLDNLVEVLGELKIYQNGNLTALNLNSLNLVGDDLIIYRNSELCTYIANDLRDQVLGGSGIGGDIEIYDNKGCSIP